MSERTDNLDEQQQHDDATGEPATLTVTIAYDSGGDRTEYRAVLSCEDGCRGCLGVKAYSQFDHGLGGLIGRSAADAGLARLADEVFED